jgi:dihydroxyacetone kinase-like protein
MSAGKIQMNKTRLKAMFSEASRLLREKSDELSQIDARCGDGDHGVTVNKIAAVIEQETDKWSETSPKTFLTELGHAVLAVSGGAAAPLWGTFIGGLALPLEDEEEIDPPLLKRMFSSALEEMQTITNAKAGDKTLMDALIPAVENACGAEDSLEAILAAASSAARRGAENTKDFVARFGRAKNYKERSLGVPDPGAVGLSLFFEGLVAGYEQ